MPNIYVTNKVCAGCLEWLMVCPDSRLCRTCRKERRLPDNPRMRPEDGPPPQPKPVYRLVEGCP